MKKLSQKIGLFLISTVIIVVFILQGVFAIIQSQIQNQVSSVANIHLQESYDLMIKSEVEIIISTIQGIYDVNKAAGLSEEEIKNLAKEYIRSTKYGTTGYFWIDDSAGNNVLLPPKPEVEGTNRFNSLDANNYPLVQNIIKQALAGGGYTDYYFPKPNETESSKKRAYSAYFEPFDWCIGTGNYVDDIDQVVQSSELKHRALSRTYALVFGGISVVLLGIIFLATLIVGKRIAKPLVDLNIIMSKAKEGDLTVKSQYAHQDETGQLADGFNVMISNLGRMTKDTIGLSDKLSSSFIEIENITQTVLSSSEETANTVLTISEDVVKQAEATEKANERIQNIVQSLDEMNLNMTEAQHQAQMTIRAIEEGTGMIEVQKTKMSENRVASEKASQAILELSRVATEIEGIIDVIDNISRQTNLLALNAAIEAARAGEAGKGFSVVAEEIRKLAEQTIQSTKQINGIINLVGTSVTVAVNEIKIAMGTVTAQEDALNNSVTSFVSITQAVGIISDKVNTTAVKSYNVNKDANKASHEMNDVASIAEKTAGSMEKVTAITQEQASSLSDIDLYVKGVSELISSLNESVKRFKL